jgi:hypothetical protein
MVLTSVTGSILNASISRPMNKQYVWSRLVPCTENILYFLLSVPLSTSFQDAIVACLNIAQRSGDDNCFFMAVHERLLQQ